MASISEHLANPDKVRKASDVAIYGGGVVGVLGSAISKLTLTDWGVIIGIAVGVLGGLFGAILKWREHKLKVKELEERRATWKRLAEQPIPYFNPTAALKAMELHNADS